MGRWESFERPDGFRYQAATPKRTLPDSGNSANGLILRGVVTAVYVVDDDSHPQKDGWTSNPPCEMYCDVLTYGSSRVHWGMVSRALVAQPLGAGIQSGKIWKPRATTKNVSGSTTSSQGLGSVSQDNDPAYWDGDHVLVGFLDDRLDQPVIIGAVPHTRSDEGIDSSGERRRLRLRLEDGDPSFWKHHGTVYGVEPNGDWLVDTRFAHDGALDDLGKEPAPDTTGKGSQRSQLPLDAATETTLEDMTDQTNPQVKVRLKITKDAADLDFVDQSVQIYVDATAEIIELGAQGSGYWASRDDKVQSELFFIRDELNSLADALAKHRHAQEMCWVPLIPNPAQPIGECQKAPIAYNSPGLPMINFITQAEATRGNAPLDQDAGALEFVFPNVPPNPHRESGLFPDGGDPQSTASERVKLDK